MPDNRKTKRLRIQRTPAGKYRLLMEEGKGNFRVIGGDMDTHKEAERRKDTYAKTYGLK